MLLLGSSLTHRFRGVRWSFLWVALATAQAQPIDIGGTLPEDHFPVLRPILVEALKKSPRTLAAEIEIALQEARVLGTNAQRLPRLGADFSYASNQAAVAGDNRSEKYRDNGLFYRLEVNQALFHWGALKNDTLRARISVALAEKSYAEAYRLVLLTLRQGFVELVAKKAFLLQQRHRVELRRAAVALEVDRLSRGLVSSGFVEGQKLTLREHELELERAEVLFTGALRLFARAAGLADFPESQVPDAIPPAPYPAAAASAAVAAMLRDGGRSSFEAQVYELQAREADLNYKIARVRQLPKFNASAGYYLENTTNANQFNVTQQGVERQAVGVNASWAIFDGLATRAAKREAAAGKRLAERRLATAGEEAMERAQALERLLKVEATAMELAEVRRGIAQESFKHQSEEVALGNLPPTAAQEAKSQVYLSEANQALARANYLRVWSEFVSLAGMDPILNTLPVRHVREKR